MIGWRNESNRRTTRLIRHYICTVNKQWCVIILTLCSACNNNIEKGSLRCNLLGNSDLLTAPKGKTKSGVSERQLHGAWTDSSSKDTVFAINGSEMYIKDHYSVYKYQLKNDSITINYLDCRYKAKIYFYKDTLITESEKGLAKFRKLKSNFTPSPPQIQNQAAQKGG